MEYTDDIKTNPIVGDNQVSREKSGYSEKSGYEEDDDDDEDTVE